MVWDGGGGQDGDGRGVFRQRYDDTGSTLGAEFQVNSYTTGSQIYSSLCCDAAGNFVVAWSGGDGQDGDAVGIFAQRYDDTGAALGTEFQVNTFTTSVQYRPSIGCDSDGDFIVVWASGDPLGPVTQDGDRLAVVGQRYDGAGVALGAEFLVNTYTTSNQRRPRVAASGGGGFVVVWYSETQDGGGSGIFAQRYDAAGASVGTEFRVNSYTTFEQYYPRVDVAGNDDFVVVWQSGGSRDGSGYAIFGQRYDSTGVAQGVEFLVNTYTTGSQYTADVSAAAGGEFVVTWSSYGQDDSNYGVFGQRFAAGGAADGSEFQVNAYTTGAQGLFGPAVDCDADGDFVVAWTSYQDGDVTGVYAQRYENQAKPLRHFACYKAKTKSKFTIVANVALLDQFEPLVVNAKAPKLHCNPVNKKGEDPDAPNDPDHLLAHAIKRARRQPKFAGFKNLRVVNQFGELRVDAKRNDLLLVPSAKSLTQSQPPLPVSFGVDHFECYKIKLRRDSPAFVPETGITVEDQFGDLLVDVKKPTRLCNPVDKNDESPGAEQHEEHLMCYKVKAKTAFSPVSPVYVNNQFQPLTLTAIKLRELCVPSSKEEL